MRVIITRPGKRDRNGKNLAVVYAHSRTANVQHLATQRCEDGSGVLEIFWADGALCTIAFASYVVMCEWVEKAKMFRGVGVVKHSKEIPNALR